MIDPVLEQMSTNELSKMRRDLLRILHSADPKRSPANREGVCRRIQRLCREGVIPEPIGDLMHVVRKCRNRAEYEDRVPEGMEARAIRSAWAAIEDWRSMYRSKAAKNIERQLPTREVM